MTLRENDKEYHHITPADKHTRGSETVAKYC